MSQYLEPFAASKQKTKEGNRLREMEKQGHILLDESAAEVVRLVMEGDLDAAEEITREYDKVGHKMLGSRMPEDVKQRLIEHYKEAA
jgi:hypothetical protein